MYKFKVFKFKITLRLSESFFGTSKIGETNWSFAGFIIAMAVFSFRIETSFELERERKKRSKRYDLVVEDLRRIEFLIQIQQCLK